MTTYYVLLTMYALIVTWLYLRTTFKMAVYEQLLLKLEAPIDEVKNMPWYKLWLTK